MKSNETNYNLIFESVISQYYNSINDATNYNLNLEELDDLLNLVTYITLTTK